MERIIIEYLANAFWQLPVLAAGAWVMLRVWKPGPAAQHRVWLAVLALGLLLPLRGAVPATASLNTELPIAGVALRPASFSHVDLPRSTQTAQSVLSEGSGSEATIKTANLALSGQQEQGSWVALAAALLSSCSHRVSVSGAVAQWIVGLWLAVALWGLLRIALAWRAARRLVANSREAALGVREHAVLADCARRVGVAAPEVRETNAIAGPVIVGATRPVLLWPEDFARTSPDEMQAAVFHELAHVRRRDYGMNLLCEMAALPLRWHPAMHGVERRIRATREMACDAMAAEAMDSETIYAECLVRLARRIVGGAVLESSLAAGLFNGNVMEERVMRLVRGKSVMGMRARFVRGAAGAVAMAAALALAGTFHVAPAMAQDAAVALAQRAPVSQTEPARNVPAAALWQQASPVPAATPKTTKSQTHVRHEKRDSEKPVVIMDGQERDLTPAERARVEKELAEAQKRIAEATAKINSPEFRQQIEEAQRKALQTQTFLNSAEFRQKMADAQKRIAEETAKLNSPEFRKTIQDEIDAATKLNSAEFQKQMADAQKQIAAATARLNSPEFKKQMEDAARVAAKVNSAEIQKQMADAQKQVADAMARLKAEQEKQTAK